VDVLRNGGDLRLHHNLETPPRAELALECLEGRVYMDASGLIHTVASLSTPRSRISAVAAGGQAVFAGGIDPAAGVDPAVDVYDSSTDQWSTTALPHPAIGGDNVSAGSKLVFLYGAGLEVYDTNAGTWADVQLPEPREGPVAAIDGKVYVFGPTTTGTPTAATFDVYDTQTGQLSKGEVGAADDPKQVVTLGRSLVLIGAAFGDDTTSVTLYDTRTGGIARTHVPHLRSFQVAGVGTSLVFAGGYSTDSHVEGPSSVVDIYNTVTGGWSYARLSQPRLVGAIATVGSAVVFAGGNTGVADEPISGVADVFDTVSGRWTAAHLSHPVSFGYFRVVTLGTKAVFGGGDQGSEPLASVVDVYDARTGKWSTAPLAAPRDSIAATAAGTKALFAGGHGDGAGSGSAVDLYTDTAPAPALSGFVGSGKNKVSVQLGNSGDAELPGSYILSLYATRALNVGRGAVRIGKIRVEHPLRPGESIRLIIPVNTPTTLPAGTYHLLASTGTAGNHLAFASHRKAVTVTPSALRKLTPRNLLVHAGTSAPSTLFATALIRDDTRDVLGVRGADYPDQP